MNSFVMVINKVLDTKPLVTEYANSLINNHFLGKDGKPEKSLFLYCPKGAAEKIKVCKLSSHSYIGRDRV